MKYEAAKGNYWQNYIGEVGEWVKVSRLKYWWLKIQGFKVRKVKQFLLCLTVGRMRRFALMYFQINYNC